LKDIDENSSMIWEQIREAKPIQREGLPEQKEMISGHGIQPREERKQTQANQQQQQQQQQQPAAASGSKKQSM